MLGPADLAKFIINNPNASGTTIALLVACLVWVYLKPRFFPALELCVNRWYDLRLLVERRRQELRALRAESRHVPDPVPRP